MKYICDWHNCNKIGEYKAPVEKDNSKKYRLLCLEHIKEFNNFSELNKLLKKYEVNANFFQRKLKW